MHRLERRPGWWSPRADVCESDEAIVFSCDVPGIAREDIQVLMWGGYQGGRGGLSQQAFPLNFHKGQPLEDRPRGQPPTVSLPTASS